MGANWAYDELRDGVKVSSYKQWSIASFAEMGDARHDKQATKAFLQVRPSALDFSHKWISSREKGERMLFWEKEDQFTPDLEPRNTTFFVPRKIRLNEGLAAPLESPEKERYQQIEYLPGRPEPVVIECLDSWNVIPVEEVRSMPSSNFPERFAKAICHRRVGTVMSVHPPELRAMYGDTEKIFCYVRGVGKVYERSLGLIRAEEVLEHFSNPGKCPSPLCERAPCANPHNLAAAARLAGARPAIVAAPREPRVVRVLLNRRGCKPAPRSSSASPSHPWPPVARPKTTATR